MKLTEIDKTVRKIKKLLDKHKYNNERLELDKITDKSFNLYLTGKFNNGTIYEQKHIAQITMEGR